MSYCPPQKSKFCVVSLSGNCLSLDTKRGMYFIRRKGLNRPSGFFSFVYFSLFFELSVVCRSQAPPAHQTRCRGLSRTGVGKGQ